MRPERSVMASRRAGPGLARSAAPSAGGPRPALHALAGSSGRPVRVLIVDDHPVLADALRAALEESRDLMVVGVAGSVVEALEAVRRSRPDVVVMDYRLPDEDGLSGAQRLMRERKGCRVVLLTGAGSDELRRLALAAGCSAYLTKDQRLEEVLEVVRGAGGQPVT